MRIKARATFDPTAQAEFNVPKGQGFLTLQIDADYRVKMGEEVAKIRKRQQTKLDEALDRWNSTPPAERGPKPVYRDFLVELEFDLNVFYKKRSVKQSNLIRGLYEIEANYLNGTPMYQNGYWSAKFPGHVITPQEIHDDDVEQFAEKFTVRWRREDAFVFARAMEHEGIGRQWGEYRGVPGDPEKVDIVIAKTTAFLNVKEASEWAARIIQRLTDGGLLRSDEARFIGLRNDFKEIVKGGRK